MAVTNVELRVDISGLELMTEKQLNRLHAEITSAVALRLYDIHPSISVTVQIESVSGVLIYDPTD